MNFFRNKSPFIVLIIIILSLGVWFLRILYRESNPEIASIHSNYSQKLTALDALTMKRERIVREAMKVVSDSPDYSEPGRKLYLDVGLIMWESGSFSKKEAKEAVVYLHDRSQGGVDSPFEFWLFEYDKKWKAVSMLRQAKCGRVEVHDIDNDGIKEIFIFVSHCGRGCLRDISLVKLTPDYKQIRIFNTSGSETPMNYYNKIETKSIPTLEFVDIENDGIKEIRETRLEESRRWNDSKKYEIISTTTTVTTYRYIDGKYQKIDKNIKR